MRTRIIAATLVVLAVVPMTCYFVFSGAGEDELAEWSDGEEEIVGAGEVASASSAPVFKGFEDSRYQAADRIIRRLVDEYNRNPAAFAGATPEQAAKLPKLTVEQVKAHMIQETGGGDVRSRAAWAKDPLQVNVPGDWNPYKRYLGLRQPRKRNEGSLEKNLRAGIMLLVRKGYGVAGQPAANNPAGTFDGWQTALRRYNGRSDKAADGRPYRDAYAERILRRSRKPDTETPIQIKTNKKK